MRASSVDGRSGLLLETILLTRAGRTHLAAKTTEWARLTRAVGFVLDMG